MIYHADLSTYVWVIFIVIGLIGNAVSSARKKSQAHAKPKVNPEPEDMPEPNPMDPVFEQVPDVPSFSSSNLDNRFSTPKKTKKKSKNKPLPDEGGRIISSSNTTEPELNEDSSDEEPFDLRKAVIYSEILNRKY